MISGRVNYYAGNNPPDPIGTIVGRISVVNQFTLNGAAVIYDSGKKPVVCR